MKKHKVKQSGVTLIEVLISAVLLSTAMLWISDGHMKSLSLVSDGSNRSAMMRLSEEMLERIKLNLVPQLYKTEINGVTNRKDYCKSLQSCVGAKCMQSEVVKYDVQQSYCHDLDGIDNLSMKFECFDVNSGSALTNCAERGTLRGRVSINWDSKGKSTGKLSAHADALLLINRALSFNGANDYLKVSGAGTPSANGDFTMAMWIKPKSLAAADFFGAPGDGGRNTGLSIKAGGGIEVDAYSRVVTPHSERYCVTRIAWTCWDYDVRRWNTVVYTSHKQVMNNIFAAEVWVHIAWIRSGNNYSLYKNGALVRKWAVDAPPLHVQGYFFIGKINKYFKGEIDDVLVYSSAILSSQVRGLMHGRVVDGLLAVHVDFEGSSFNDAKNDKSKNNRTINAYGGLNDKSLIHAVR
ncbi:MAG: prepilin-type N-terminal cleavage/methylation domain-containing protein [Candidatus Endonucleobacter sp. (ex Gigantidas childressi)]|nr:prepilin-type N-terminal cleavage/methylation domain-containing protein [Candidatus Endonucleobacter sp. (ex Gigantidas childressi)]